MKAKAQHKKYLSFFLQGEEYCIDIQFVKEIMEMRDITKLPQTLDFLLGVINLRGVIIPIIDLRKKLELPDTTFNEKTCIIVIEFEYEDILTQMGIIVDETNEVISIPKNAISNLPYVNSRIKIEYIEGIAEINEKLKIILDIQKALKDSEFIDIQKLNTSKSQEEYNEEE